MELVTVSDFFLFSQCLRKEKSQRDSITRLLLKESIPYILPMNKYQNCLSFHRHAQLNSVQSDRSQRTSRANHDCSRNFESFQFTQSDRFVLHAINYRNRGETKRNLVTFCIMFRFDYVTQFADYSKTEIIHYDSRINNSVR